MDEKEKERILNRMLNRKIYNYVKKYGTISRADVRRRFVSYGNKVVSQAINELIFFDLFSTSEDNVNLRVK